MYKKNLLLMEGTILNYPNSILLTGLTGYLGSNFAFSCIEKGITVHALVRSAEKLDQKFLNKNIIIHKIPETTEGFLEIINKISTDTVVHLASFFVSDHRLNQTEDLIESNLVFPSRLIEACSRAGVRYFLNAGSVAQHFDNVKNQPVCLYAAQKQAIEDILNYYVLSGKMKALSLKIFDTYGPEDTRAKIINLLFKYADSSEILSLSSPEQKIHLVHVKDVINAFFRSIQILKSDNYSTHISYSLPSKKAITLFELCNLFERLTKKKINKNWNERTILGKNIFELWNGDQPLKGWEPSIDLENGIKMLIST